MSLARYNPKVKCIFSATEYIRRDVCAGLLNEMDVSAGIRIFGDATASGVDVRTPYVIKKRKKFPTCKVRCLVLD